MVSRLVGPATLEEILLATTTHAQRVSAATRANALALVISLYREMANASVVKMALFLLTIDACA